MRHLKRLGPTVTAILAVACGAAAGPASATTMDPASTAFTLTSTNFALSVDGGSPITCADTTLSGVTPASGGVTWISVPFTPRATSCLQNGGVTTVQPSLSCHTAATQPILHVEGIFPPRIVITWGTCSIHVVRHATGCTMNLPTLPSGNGTAGLGGIMWTNRSPQSLVFFNSVTLTGVVSNGVGVGCPSAGTHSGTLSGQFTVVLGTNVTVTP